MKEKPIILSDKIVARINKLVLSGDIEFHPWTYGNNSIVKCSLANCYAVWVIRNPNDEPGEIKKVGFTRNQVEYISLYLKKNYGFAGDIELSQSEKSWNILRIGKEERRLLRKERLEKWHQELIEKDLEKAMRGLRGNRKDFSRNREGDLIYYDGEWYHEDHF